MIRVSSRARRHEDRSGDPLDGLVNLFDVGLVLSVAFLLAALSSLNLSDTFTKKGLRPNETIITVPKDQPVNPVPPDGQKVVGQGTKAGTVYRLRDGSLVYVQDDGTTTDPTTGTTTPPVP